MAHVAHCSSVDGLETALRKYGRAVIGPFDIDMWPERTVNPDTHRYATTFTVWAEDGTSEIVWSWQSLLEIIRICVEI